MLVCASGCARSYTHVSESLRVWQHASLCVDVAITCFCVCVSTCSFLFVCLSVLCFEITVMHCLCLEHINCV